MLFHTGIGTYLQSLIPRIENSFSTTILVKKRDLDWAKRNFCSKVTVFDADIYTVKEQLAYPFSVPSTDLFWSPHYNVPVLPVPAKKRIVTIHDLCHLACPDFFPSLKRAGASVLIEQAVKKSDLIVTVSEFSLKEILSRFSFAEKKVHVLPNGVLQKKARGKKIFFEGQIQSPFILYVGGNKPHKNLERLVKAFLLLPPCYQLVLVSSGSGLPVHPRIKTVSDVSEDELAFLYETAEILVQPSLYEGFGLPPLEAMSAGCVVVSSHAASLPEVCGDAAVFIDPHSVDSLHKGMAEALDNQSLRESLIMAGYKRANMFSWDKTASDLTRLLVNYSSLKREACNKTKPKLTGLSSCK